MIMLLVRISMKNIKIIDTLRKVANGTLIILPAIFNRIGFLFSLKNRCWPPGKTYLK